MSEPVNLRWTTTRSIHDVRSWVKSTVVDVLRRSGFRVVTEQPEQLVLVRRSGPPGILLFVSWFAYLMSPNRSDQVVFRFAELPDSRTELLTIGTLPRKVAAIMRELPQD